MDERQRCEQARELGTALGHLAGVLIAIHESLDGLMALGTSLDQRVSALEARVVELANAGRRY